MGSVTKNFANEAPLSPAVKAAITSAFNAGWADPNKSTHDAANARQLRDQAIAEISAHLGVSTVLPIGENTIAIQSSIMGFLKPDSVLAVSVRDRREVMAIAKSRSNSIYLTTNTDGQIVETPSCDVFAFQIANSESGVIQNPNIANGILACDATASGARVSLPKNWASAAFDARSWGGPAGISFLALNNEKDWSYPYPHVGAEKTPGGYSLPLLIGAAIALNEFKVDRAEKDAKILKLNQLLRDQLVNLAIPKPIGMPHLITIGFESINGEQLVSKLNERGFACDTGSACSADDLRPSRTLEAMGLPNKGNLRITIHDETSDTDVIELAKTIIELVN